MATLAKYCSILFILNVFNSCGQQVETDTTANVKYIYKQVPFPYSEIRTLRLTVETKQSDKLFFLNCSDGSLVANVTLTTPVHCEKLYTDNENKINKDSLKSIFYKCMEDYYLQDSNHAKSDTLYILDKFTVFNNLNLTDEERYFVLKMEVYNADTSKYLISEFYSINELKGECLEGNFRRKSVKQWSDGKKNGVWKYFDKSGRLIQLIEYKSDKIIRREDY
jgi:antitoxin component YwqK of YwqJK toxin-antitoxin module